MSDCQPILLSGGTIAWYVTDENRTTVYSFDPFNPDSVRTGWIQVGGKWYHYYFGTMYKNKWIEENGKWYYLDASGVMQTGWQTISGKTYYFKDSGVMAANEWCKGWR